ncbi:MAG: hypothetical protein WBM11_15475 [Terriglobales bacterium]
MSNSALLDKLNGYTRTFVVHSNASPNATAAAMGAAMGRSERIGTYFNLLRKPSSGVQARAAAAAGCDLSSSEVSVDFIGDWSAFLRQKGMPTCGLAYVQSRTLEDNTMRYLNAHRRIPITAPRTVHESRELSIPQEHKAGYEALKALIRSGGDLRPYLSRDILKKKRPDKNDRLLNSWGIQHLHFRPLPAEGTLYILLCRITDTDVFVIQALPHGHDHDAWVVDTSLLQILHDNWPEEITAGKCRGIRGEAAPSSERLALRNKNANFATTMTDGTLYLAPGGGLMASGDCFEDRSNCDKMFAELAYWQDVVKSNAAHFRAALNWPPSKELSIRMMFEDRDCWFCEPTTGSAISLTIEK